ncbi:DUF7507 domain-containing protein [Streptomyces sp. NPDC001020]
MLRRARLPCWRLSDGTFRTASSAPDFDSAGHLWRLSNTTPGDWAEIDLVPGSPTFGQTIASGTVGYPGNQFRALGDWSYMTGPLGPGLYGVGDLVGNRIPHLLYFSRVTHTFTDLGEVGGMPPPVSAVSTSVPASRTAPSCTYSFTSGTVYRVNVTAVSTVPLPQSPGAGRFADGAQCVPAAAGSTINVVKQVAGRNTPLDQFRVGLTNPGGNEVGSATTSGNQTRAETGPLPVASGQTYRLTDRLENDYLPPRPDLYDTSATCVDNTTGAAVPLVFDGGSWAVRVPRTGAALTCTVTNRARGTGSIQPTKHADPPVVTAVGQTVHYTMDVRNTGDTAVHGLTLNDSQGGGPHPCSLPPSGRHPGQSTTCVVLTHVVTQEDINRGYIYDTATVHGHRQSGPPRPRKRLGARGRGPAVAADHDDEVREPGHRHGRRAARDEPNPLPPPHPRGARLAPTPAPSPSRARPCQRSPSRRRRSRTW